MFLTNRWFTEVDDECAIIDRAAQPVSQTLRLYLSGAAMHEHPPLYDLILSGWIRLTGGEQDLLRLPAIIFYIAGAWVLATVAKRQAGRAAQACTLLIVISWPYGFHFGRLATWYSFCFLLVSLVTWRYFRYLEACNLKTWCWLVACSILLVYSNYFGWAMLGCLAADFLIQREKGPSANWLAFAGTCFILLAAYIPIARAFFGELRAGLHVGRGPVNLVLTASYDLYCVFVSESAAPWFWRIGVPVGVAIAACLLIAMTKCPFPARRFLFYFMGLLAVMSVVGIANTKRMLLISPWLVLPLGITLARASRATGRILSIVLLFIGAAGWYGIVSRNLYAAPHWVEPWESIAQNAAALARNGGIVIGENPSFFFYLTYDLAPKDGAARHFAGLLPDSARRPNVYSAAQWTEAGEPLARDMILAKGPHFQIPEVPMREAEDLLSARCTLEKREQMVPDPGAEWKERFAPGTGQASWRVEILKYDCR